ncbi:MAG: fatty acid desaturase [Gammaproteobacteria bacterium]|nr:fatty acid desaturase [Gammaproteobacteria bacterium]
MTSKYDTRQVQITGAFIAFVLVHVACVGVFFTGVSWSDVALAVGLYALRMFGITAGYHRYFAHRAFQTGRAFQFLLAFIAQSSLQSGAVWWAAKHRDHHSYSDTPRDSHSPRQYGFWFSHLGWIFHEEAQKADYGRAPDLTRYPELMWLDRNRFLPGIVLGFATWALFGWSGLFVGFFCSSVALYHATFAINSVAHVVGRQRYLTGDDSRNNWWLALLTFGEGWHNNHHYFMASTRQGFRWWEVDVTYYLLKGLSALRLVWGLREPPAHVVAGQRSLSAEIKERVAAHLAASFSVEKIAERARVRWAAANPGQRWEDFCKRAQEKLAQVHLPELPSLDEMRARAQRMFARSPAMDEIIARAREMLEQAVAAQLALQPVAVRA